MRNLWINLLLAFCIYQLLSYVQVHTSKEYYLSQDLGTTIMLNDIKEFYVWIPRFKYKLWNVTGTPGVDSYDAYNK